MGHSAVATEDNGRRHESAITQLGSMIIGVSTRDRGNT